MSDKWYVVHVNTGSEDTVRKYILNQMEMDKCTDLIKDILVPTETIEEQVKGGKKKRSEKKFFPGYILVKTDLNEESWHFLKEIPKVIGFVGGKIKDGKLEANSVPSVDESEIDKMRNKIQEGTLKPTPKVVFEKGESVKVTEGPFESFTGIVEEVKIDKGKVQVLVEIFGRATPIDLDFNQIERI
ncbi:MAG: transcription termination/antitermination protein NusG [Thermodesulfobacteriota bacterium]|nr:transcription termination/antitermination protein NusG [Thermodesulfobacteriota bacterium]|tara:strand:+ start:512 stop:1069 length:558 start_codon:yes stop_codon:yes gene_type:complete